MVAILQQLHEEDHFDIVLFGSVNVFWKSRPVKATEENLSEALEYVKQIGIAGGWKDDSGFMISVIRVAPSHAASSGWVCFFPSRDQHQWCSLGSSCRIGQSQGAGIPSREKHRHDYPADRWNAKRRYRPTVTDQTHWVWKKLRNVLHMILTFFLFLVISSFLLCLFKESPGSQRSRKTCNPQWGETCLCSVLDLATV